MHTTLPWAVSRDITIRDISYNYQDWRLQVGVRHQVILDTRDQDHTHFGVIYQIEECAGQPVIRVTLHDGTQRSLGVAQIYWVREQPDSNICRPAKFFEINSDRRVELEIQKAQT